MFKKSFIVVVYCLPAMAAVSIALWSYHGRVIEVGKTLHFYQKAVEQANAENQIEEKLLSGITMQRSGSSSATLNGRMSSGRST